MRAPAIYRFAVNKISHVFPGKRALYLVVFTVFALGMLSPAHAQLKISDFFIDLHSDAPSGQLYAANNGDETMYLKVTAEEVIHPGTDKEIIRTAENPRELGLLASPQRLVVEPGQEKRIRLLALEMPEHDRFYKVTVTPVVGEIENSEMIGVKLLIAYAAWVFVRPENSEPHIVGVRDGDELVIRNEGTTHAELTAGKRCDSDDECTDIERFRVFAGKEKRVRVEALNQDDRINFRAVYAGKAVDVAF